MKERELRRHGGANVIADEVSLVKRRAMTSTELREERKRQLAKIRNNERAEILGPALFDRVKERRSELLKKGIWRDADEKDTRLEEMKDSHLASLINLYKRMRPPFYEENAEEMIAPLLAEAERRVASGGG